MSSNPELQVIEEKLDKLKRANLTNLTPQELSELKTDLSKLSEIATNFLERAQPVLAALKAELAEVEKQLEQS